MKSVCLDFASLKLYETLAEYDFFEEPLAGFTPVSGVVPYQELTALGIMQAKLGS